MFIYTFAFQKDAKLNYYMNKQLIYFDNNSTTKVDDCVIEAMLPYFSTYYGNSSSATHAFGWEAMAAVEKSSNEIANILGCNPNEIIYTSGATESINLAIKGITQAYKSKGNHIITTLTEHKATLDVFKKIEEQGFNVTYLNVDREGLIDISELEKNITKNTILVSIMSVNNETGVMQDIESIGSLCLEKNVLFFTDATQHVGKLNFKLNELNISCAAFSAHKFHGPKGVGGLFLKSKNPKVNLIGQINGGQHQNGKRSGTLNVPGIVGMAKALTNFNSNYWDITAHVSKIKNYFEHNLLDIEGLRINGSTKHRIYNTSNLFFPTSNDLKTLFNKFAFSSGSACTSSLAQPSHVLQAMKFSNEEIKNCYRFSFSKYNTLDEVRCLVNEAIEIYKNPPVN